MHPWMIEQVAREHRRDLLAWKARPRVRPARRLQRFASYIRISRKAQQPTGALAPLPRDKTAAAMTVPGRQNGAVATEPTPVPAPPGRATAA
jgi:hypothetical protein